MKNKIIYTGYYYHYWRYMFGKLLIFCISQGIPKGKIAQILGKDASSISQILRRFDKYEKQDRPILTELSRIKRKANKSALKARNG